MQKTNCRATRVVRQQGACAYAGLPESASFSVTHHEKFTAFSRRQSATTFDPPCNRLRIRQVEFHVLQSEAEKINATGMELERCAVCDAHAITGLVGEDGARGHTAAVDDHPSLLPHDLLRRPLEGLQIPARVLGDDTCAFRASESEINRRNQRGHVAPDYDANQDQSNSDDFPHVASEGWDTRHIIPYISHNYNSRSVPTHPPFGVGKRAIFCYTVCTQSWLQQRQKAPPQRCKKQAPMEPLTLPSLRGLKRCVAAPACISARPDLTASTTSFGRYSTTRATKPWVGLRTISR